jgi:hypothetical protein
LSLLKIASPLKSSKSTLFVANHPEWGTYATLRIGRNDKSFVYRFYADSSANSFIYRIYEKRPGGRVQRPEASRFCATLSFTASLPLLTLALASFVCDNRNHLRAT